MEIVDIRGLLVPLGQAFDKKIIEIVMDYKPKDGDIIIATYPKTGTTWIQYIVWQILHKGESFPSFHDAAYRLMPFMEMVGEEAIDKLTPPRFYKTHFPYNYCNINPKAKYIYVYRNPKDTVVSYYYFYNSIYEKTLDFNIFVEKFLSGEVPYSDFFDHTMSFYSHKDDDNVLLVSYEKMKLDTEKEILRLAKFIGDEYYQSLVNDGSLLKKIITVTSFDYMKKHLAMHSLSGPNAEKPSDGGIKDSSKEHLEEKKPIDFFRKGIIGDGKLHLTLEQENKIMAKASSKMEGTDMLEEWRRLDSI